MGGYIGHPFEVPKNICDLKDVPVWAFHGRKDVMVPAEAEQRLVDALVACGGDAKLTINPNYGHDIEIPTYGEPGLYDWLLEQSRK
jgi:predicted esterase